MDAIRLAEVIGRAMLSDRHRLRRRLEAMLRRGEADPESLEKLAAMAEASAGRAQKRAENVPAVSYPEELPVSQRRDDIVAAIREYRAIVVCGETGSGKTTQLPKMCLEAGRGRVGVIGHTQPRRIAARTVAARIAAELGSPLGTHVGYKVRFHDETSPDGYVKLMTDGILLAETQSDRFLNAYDTIIVDEAHERSLNVDFLLGHLRNLLDVRPELKVIVTSATIDPEKFQDHFGGPAACPIVDVTGRTYPVEVRYRPLADDDEGGEAGDDAPFDAADGIVRAVEELGRDPVGGAGDTLVFLSGEREIREAAKALYDAGGGHHGHSSFEVLPLYARLNTAEQDRVFRPHAGRRVVLATNVAETSLTVPNVTGVVDTGLARISRYSPKGKVQRLPIEPVSRAAADQRKGRCGRVAPGVCVRLYGQKAFDERPAFTDPEIRRTNLASVILQMKAFGLGDVEAFGFIDPPDFRQVRDGYQTLAEIDALDEHRRLTDAGRVLARLPVDPKLGRMVLAADAEGCVEEMLVVAAGLSIADPRERPMEHRKAADDAHARFRAGGSDFLTLLNLFGWFRKTSRELSRNKTRQACRDAFVNHQRMLEWQDLVRQLREQATSLGLRLSREEATGDQVHRAVLPGLLGNVGRKGEGNEYDGVRGRKFFLFPGSVTFSSKPQWVVAAELVETTRLYARVACAVKPEWIEQAAEHLLTRTYGEPFWQRKTGRVAAPVRVSLMGLQLAKRNVDYGRVDPRTARSVFIRSALVDDDMDSGAAFFRHNRRLVREVELLEAKTRRSDLLVDPASRFAFYDARVGADAVDQKSFDRWRGRTEREDRRRLFMTLDDLLARRPDAADAAQFPDDLDAGLLLPVSYRFDAGHPDDGVTVTVPLARLHAADADRLDWLVPGLFEEKLVDLVRTLPKQLRTHFVPVPEAAHRAAVNMTYGVGRLTDALAAALGRPGGVSVKPTDFRPDDLPDYLKMNVRVVDDENRVVAAGRDLATLRRQLRVAARRTLADVPDPAWNRDGLTTWDVGDLPDRVEIRRAGGTFQGFPALVDAGRTVALRLLESPDAARAAHRRGVRRLLLLDYAKEIRHLLGDLPDLQRLRLHFAPLGDAARLREHLAEAVGDRLAMQDPADVRSADHFGQIVHAAWGRLAETVRDVGTIAADVLARRHAVDLALSRPVAPVLVPSVADMRDQLAHLVPPDFLIATPPGRLADLPRYLRGIEIRLHKLLDAGLARDSRDATRLFPYWKAWLDHLADPDPAASPAAARDWADFRWQIEEFRVSLFAQTLGTRGKISEKVLRDTLDRLRVIVRPVAV